jgi:hypothetical protein
MKVFPVHTAVRGQCSCGDWNCRAPAKHPRTAHGFRDATSDLRLIARWWARFPNANIGIRTGEPSNLVVLDVDSVSAFTDLKGRYPKVPWERIPTTCTGRGYQSWFRYPGGPLPSRLGILPQVDVRADDAMRSAEAPDRFDNARYIL